MGAKRRYTTFWQPSDLKTDADIPEQASITIGAGYLDCANISITGDIKTVLVASTDELYDLCNLTGTFVTGGESGKINAWARYKPGQTAYDVALPSVCTDNPTFTYTAPAFGKIGDFAGYNHNENTKPVYWAAPHQSTYVIYGNTEIKGGLQRGKLCPILSSNVEDETYWSRVKVQVWRSVNAGAYSLVYTTGYIDLSEPSGDSATLLYTLGANGETIGNNYTLCFRPVYMDSDDVTPLAVCEGGVEIISYRKWGEAEDIEDTFTTTLNSITSYDLGGGWLHMRVDYDFDINNLMTTALGCAVRLRFEDTSLTWQQDFLLGSEIHINAGSSANFTNTDVEITETIVDDGTCSVFVQVSFDSGANWVTIGTLTTTLPTYNNI